MKKSWLGGILLGVSLALLLAGGVALAATVSVSVDKECFECWPREGEPTDEQAFTISVVLDLPHLYWEEDWTVDGQAIVSSNWAPDPPGGHDGVWSYCVTCEGELFQDCLGESPQSVSTLIPVPYGEMRYRVWELQVGDSDEDKWIFADECEAGVPFVPEASTMVLLGSGLAGLAGYASLRLRGWRKRG